MLGVRRDILRVAWLLLAPLACGDPTGTEEDPVTSWDANVAPSILAAADLLVAADPKMTGFAGWPLRFAVEGASGLQCQVVLDRNGQALATVSGDLADGTCLATWDGRGPEGWLSPGAVAATASLWDAEGTVVSSSVVLEVVRLGFAEIDLVATSGEGRVSLLYSEMGGVVEGFYEVALDHVPWRLESLDESDGTPRTLPGVWEDVKSPPLDADAADGVEMDTYNLPTAWVAGAGVDAFVQFAPEAPAVTEVRLVAPTGTILSDGTYAGGGSVQVTFADPPVSAVGRFDRELRWTFESRPPGGTWVAIPGEIVTVHRLYGILGQPIFDYPNVPHRAWVDVVDQVASWVDGATADPTEAGAAIVAGVFYELGLVYDNEHGASAYSWYPGWGWSRMQFELTAFQRRSYGNVINCSDAASIVSTYANMVGIDLRYHILERPDGVSFDLNFIRAIGFPEFDDTPFTEGRGAFNYHAVTGPTDGTFFDATLALDGDGTPTEAPFEETLAIGMDPDTYLFALSSEWDLIDALIDEKVRIR